MFSNPSENAVSLGCGIEGCSASVHLDSVMHTREELQTRLPVHAEHFGWILVDSKWICPKHSGRSNVCSARIGTIVSELPPGPWAEGSGDEWKDPGA